MIERSLNEQDIEVIYSYSKWYRYSEKISATIYDPPAEMLKSGRPIWIRFGIMTVKQNGSIMISELDNGVEFTDDIFDVIKTS